MTQDEVRMLDNKYALLFIRGERPVMDLKYDIMKHPDVRITTDGDADSYIHGIPWDAGESIELIHDPAQRANGFLTVAGGIVITFTKEILTMITG